MEKIYAVVDIGEKFSPARNFPTFGSLVSTVVANAVVLAGVVAFILLILAGFQFIVGAGSGDAKKMEQTRTTIFIILVGLIVIMAAVWIVQIVEKLTGLNVLQP